MNVKYWDNTSSQIVEGALLDAFNAMADRYEEQEMKASAAENYRGAELFRDRIEHLDKCIGIIRDVRERRNTYRQALSEEFLFLGRGNDEGEAEKAAQKTAPSLFWPEQKIVARPSRGEAITRYQEVHDAFIFFQSLAPHGEYYFGKGDCYIGDDVLTCLQRELDALITDYPDIDFDIMELEEDRDYFPTLE